MDCAAQAPLDIAVIGAGIAGLSAGWLLSQRHRVTLFERDSRLGGHCHTIDVPGPGGPLPVDTGFIVYNPPNYPNFSALLDHLGIATRAGEMSFSVSLDDGAFEYAGSIKGLLAQPGNLARPRLWRMMAGLARFYRTAPAAIAHHGADITLGTFLDAERYPAPFIADHILPMGAAIWSASSQDMRAYPARAFIRFFENHQLLRLGRRARWRTVPGGSRAYVARLAAPLTGRIAMGDGAARIARAGGKVEVTAESGQRRLFDRAVLACHADRALALLAAPSADERALLGAFGYSENRAVLHTDASLMPRRRRAWAGWNYLGGRAGPPSVTYWLDRLQGLAPDQPLFLTLNPARPVDPAARLDTFTYRHPLFDGAALDAQRALWRLQGQGNIWYCGSYFGAGFHEDALQAGLAAAEAIGGVRRPWRVANESGRIHLAPTPQPGAEGATAESTA